MSLKRKYVKIVKDDYSSDSDEYQLKPDSGFGEGEDDFQPDFFSQVEEEDRVLELRKKARHRFSYLFDDLITKIKPRAPIDIHDLTPSSYNWMIQGRVFRKTKIVPFKNRSGRRFFYFDIRDNTGEIHVVAFGDLCDRFYPEVSEGKMFELKNGTVKKATKYNTCPRNPYEIELNSDSVIKPVTVEPAKSIPILPEFDFLLIAKLIQLPRISDEKFDVIGVLISDRGVEEYEHEKYPNCHHLRTIVLSDQSGEIEVKIWNDRAMDFLAQSGDVVAIKSANISSADKMQYLNVFHGVFYFEPEIDQLVEAIELKRWKNRKQRLVY